MVNNTTNENEFLLMTPEEFYNKHSSLHDTRHKDLLIAFTNAYLEYLKKEKLKHLIKRTEKAIEETKKEISDINKERAAIREVKEIMLNNRK